MTSSSLQAWRTERTQELARARALVTSDNADQDLHLGTYLRVMCSEFQAFCADLYAEAADALRAGLPESTPEGLKNLIREALTSQTRLGSGNPSSQNLVRDFDRLRVNLRKAWSDRPGRADPHDRETLDGQVLRVRNELVHGNARLGAIPVGTAGAVELEGLDSWLAALDRLAGSMDTVVTHDLSAVLGSHPWRGGSHRG